MIIFDFAAPHFLGLKMKLIDCLLALKHKVENSMGWPVRVAKFYLGKYWDETGTMVISCDEATIIFCKFHC